MNNCFCSSLVLFLLRRSRRCIKSRRSRDWHSRANLSQHTFHAIGALVNSLVIVRLRHGSCTCGAVLGESRQIKMVTRRGVTVEGCFHPTHSSGSLQVCETHSYSRYAWTTQGGRECVRLTHTRVYAHTHGIRKKVIFELSHRVKFHCALCDIFR